MVHRLKVLFTKPGNLSLMPGTHVVPCSSDTSNIVGSLLKLRVHLHSFKHGLRGPSYSDGNLNCQLETY